MTDISCKGAGSWSAIEKNGFRTFCAIFFFFEELQIKSDMDKKRGEKAAPTHNKVFECI